MQTTLFILGCDLHQRNKKLTLHTVLIKLQTREGLGAWEGDAWEEGDRPSRRGEQDPGGASNQQ